MAFRVSRLTGRAAIASVIAVIGALVVPLPLAAQDEANQQFEGFHLEGFTDEGDREWVLNGSQAELLEDTVKLTDVDATYFGDQDVHLTARTGYFDKFTGNVKLVEDVVITSEKGAKVTTDTLNWDKAQDLVHTDDRVVITDEGMEAEGVGLEAHPGLKTAQLKTQVVVVAAMDPKDPDSEVVVITCDGPFFLDQLKNIAVFENNVVAKQADRTMKGDRMELYFDPETRQVEKALCLGNVVMVQGDNESYSERAVFRAEDQSFVLEGRPKMIIQPDGDFK